METKPFSLQAPEQVAKDYGGDKQKIARAVQMGLIDPTAATLAGMFIDRMRSAAQTEMAPQQTVAQQVFAPPMDVPQGLGATPQAAQMGMAPPQGAPPMMPPQGAGLDALPVPDEMFESGYAGGGLVAFQQGGPVEEDEIAVMAGRLPPEDDEDFLRYQRTMERMRPVIEGMYNPQSAASQALSGYVKGEMSPESLARRRKDDMWMALGQAGARMAQTPGSLLQAVSAGVGEALPLARESAKERRSELLDYYKTLALEEGMSNKRAAEVAKMQTDATMDVERARASREDRNLREQELNQRASADAARLGLDAQRLELARREFQANLDKAEALGVDPTLAAKRMLLSGTPEQKAVAQQYFVDINPRAAGAMNKPDTLRAMIEARGPGKGGNPYEGFSATLMGS